MGKNIIIYIGIYIKYRYNNAKRCYVHFQIRVFTRCEKRNFITHLSLVVKHTYYEYLTFYYKNERKLVKT